VNEFQDKPKAPEASAPETFLFPECLIFRWMDKSPIVLFLKDKFISLFFIPADLFFPRFPRFSLIIL